VGSNTQLLEAALTPSKSTNNSRFVHSRWQQVTTLAEAISRPITVDEVAGRVEIAIESGMAVELETGPLSVAEERYSEALYSRKYMSREWNMNGNRPGYSVEAIDAFTQQSPCASAQHL
jgi:lipoate-protein ligase A